MLLLLLLHRLSLTLDNTNKNDSTRPDGLYRSDREEEEEEEE